MVAAAAVAAVAAADPAVVVGDALFKFAGLVTAVLPDLALPVLAFLGEVDVVLVTVLVVVAVLLEDGGCWTDSEATTTVAG